MITRQLSRVVLQQNGITGDMEPETGLAIYLKTDALALVGTGTESTPGEYTFSWTAFSGYGYFWVGSTRMDKWGHQWFGEVAGSQNLDGEFEIDQPLVVNSSAQITGGITGPAGWNGIIKATAGVFSDAAAHADLMTIQGGAPGEYYHLTAAEHSMIGPPALASTYLGVGNVSNLLSGSSALTFDGTNFYVNGNVGIGTTAPGAKLDVNGVINASGGANGATPTPQLNFGTYYANSGTPTSGPSHIVLYDSADKCGFGVSGGTMDLWSAGAFKFNKYTGGTASSLNVIIDSSGNVGIGTTNPSAALTISRAISPTDYGAQAPMIEFKSYFTGYDVDTVKARISSGVSSVQSLRTDNGYLGFWTSAANVLSERMRIETNGNVGIGTTVPAGRLSVEATGAANILVGRGTNAGAGTNAIFTIMYTSATDQPFAFKNTAANGHVWSLGDGIGVNAGNFGVYDQTAPGTRLMIDNSGNVGIGTTTPTARLHLAAGVAAASGAPFKLTSGVNLTAPEDGALEYDGSHLYFTIGSTRSALGGGGGSSVWTDDGTYIYPANLARNVGVGIAAPGAQFTVNLPTPTSNTVNALLISRFQRPQTPGVKYGNAMDILLGSYGTSITSQTRVDFMLADGSTDLPDTTVMTLHGNGDVGVTGALTIGGMLASYNGITPATNGGLGIWGMVTPVQYWAAANLTNYGPFNLSNTNSPGMYRVNLYLVVGDTGGGIVTVTWGWQDAGGAQTLSTDTVVCNAGGFAEYTHVFLAGFSSYITCTVSRIGSGGAGVYIICEKLA